jgi:hypothetical protein
MKSSKIKLILGLLGAGSLLLLAVNFIAGEFSPRNAPVDAALAECQGKGWQADDLGLYNSQVWNNYGLGSTASVALKSKDPNRPKTVRVQLRRWINLPNWDVVDYKEE